MASGGDESIPLLDCNSKNENAANYKTLNSGSGSIEDLDEIREYENATGLRSRGTQTKECQSRDIHTERITYGWNNINVYTSIKNKKSMTDWFRKRNRNGREFNSNHSKHILKNVYGIAYPGELLAIMGSSGAGKTTLLNTLTFQNGAGYMVKGSRYLNGCLINNRNAVTQLSAYVEQDNLFLGTLTVKEHLIFQSLVRMGNNIPYSQKLMRVENVIAELQLEKCQNTIIGYPGRIKGISGGEMKRLSFGSEILTNPPIMFCDEPTSGLDSFIALNVITVLKSLAKRGKTVICTIHQPSSEIFSLFDKILLLAEGRTAFLGTPNDAVLFFASLGASPLDNYNPADFYIQLLAVAPNREQSCKETVKLICDSFDQSPYSLAMTTQMESGSQSRVKENADWKFYNLTLKERTYSASWFLQFRAVYWRCWVNIMREPLLVKVRLFQTVLLSLIIGIIYQQQKLTKDGVMNINGVIFTFLTNVTFQNLFGVITVFCGELPVFLKENSNKRYRVDVYFLCKTLAEIPMFLAIPIIFTTIVYFWINLNSGFIHFTLAVLILILVTNVATSFGYFISCISKNVMMALSIGPPVIIPFLLFGGFLLNAGKIPSYFKWLSYFSWFKYGYEGLLINQWADIRNISCNASDVLCPKTGQIVLESYNFEKENFWWDLISLFALILFFRFLAFMALVWKTLRYQK